ncbi:MAG: DUF4399 domain-containing protein, partial [Caldilineaceae bacterium]|nr:DUF4399 domain-containing protein [Caldilineaceae bacterium]
MAFHRQFRPRPARGFRLAFGLLIILTFALLLSACGSSGEDEAVPTQVATLAAEPTVAPTEPAPEPTATDEPTAAPEVAETSEMTATTESAATESSATEEVAPRVFFLRPTDHAVIPLTSTVKMGAEGLTVQPSGEIVEGSGHMHIMVDSPFIAAGEVIPKDETHLHFGDGALEAELALTPGPHILRLQFADGAHIALEGEQYQHEIAVNVVEGAPEQSVRFVMPTDGATTAPSFDVVMAATGLVVEPSGEIRDGAGHLHILVDTEFIAPGEVIPKDEQHLHFGSGQLMGTVELEPGDHVLRLQMADGAHIALDGDQYRAEIAVTVVEDAPTAQVMFRRTSGWRGGQDG